MKLVSLQCPSCGGTFQLSPQNKSYAFCGHCGHKVLIDDEVKKSEHKEIRIDEAKIREADVKERIRLKEIELEIMKLKMYEDEMVKYQHRKRNFLIFSAAIVAITIALIFIIKSQGYEIDPFIILPGIFVFLFGIPFPFILIVLNKPKSPDEIHSDLEKARYEAEAEISFWKH